MVDLSGLLSSATPGRKENSSDFMFRQYKIVPLTGNVLSPRAWFEFKPILLKVSKRTAGVGFEFCVPE